MNFKINKKYLIRLEVESFQKFILFFLEIIKIKITIVRDLKT